jgi:hypothetical protein
MKRFVFLLLIILVAFTSAQTLKPYILGTEIDASMDEAKISLRHGLGMAEMKILGEYAPAGDEDRWVFVVNNEQMIDAVKESGGLTAFAAAVRVALTSENGRIQVSYTNPEYLAAAYFQKQYDTVAPNYLDVAKTLEYAMTFVGPAIGTQFGMEKGLDPKGLAKYHYMFGMEYFQDVVELTEFSSYDVAKAVIRSKLAKGGDTNLVYSVEIPGQRATLYGIALSGETGEEHFLPIIDIGKPKHTAFLPYEILLLDNKAVMMHGRYRIALSFPDLTMTTFGKIMSTPGDIEDLMRSVTE